MPVPVLAPGKGKTKPGRLWTYVRDDRPAGDLAAPAVWFAYSPDRKGEHPHRHLKAFRGTLQADGYAGFNDYMRAAASRKRRVGRMFVASSSICIRRMLLRSRTKRWSASAQLYAIEREIRGRSPDERQQVRGRRDRGLC